MNADKVHAAMVGVVERGDIPALVTLGDEVLVDAIGTTTAGGPDNQPMRRDTIFRIASLTKPIAAAATMLLVNDGVLRLDDAVERWLPELANRRGLRRIDAELDDTVPARRAITVGDLLTSDPRQLPDPAAHSRRAPRRRLPPAPVADLRPGRILAPAGPPAADVPAGRALALQHELRPDGRPGRARVRALVFHLSQ